MEIAIPVSSQAIKRIIFLLLCSGKVSAFEKPQDNGWLINLKSAHFK